MRCGLAIAAQQSAYIQRDTVAELSRRGVTIVTEPFDLPDINRRLAFFADPWGNLFELAQIIA